MFVAGNAASPMPQVFDESGEFVSEIGRPGAGPGEFRMPMVGTTTPGDSILVFDIPQARFTVVASEGARTVSWERHEVAALHVLSWPDSVLAVRWAQSGSSAFALLDLSESSASILREFGAERRTPGPNETRALASAPRGGYVWVANSYDFAFHRLDLAGDTLESLAPGAPEFHTESQTPHPDSVPRSYLYGLQAIGDTLVVAYTVARADWKDAWSSGDYGPVPGVPGAVRPPPEQELSGTRVEYRLASDGSLVGAQHLPGVPIGILPDGTIAQYVVEDPGFYFVELWRRGG